MPNELDGEEGMFVGYYDKRYDPSNREVLLPYVDSYNEPKIDSEKVKKVIKEYMNRLKRKKENGIS